jgi:hypothetical protein
MSRISTYPIDNNITGDDKVIGSNSEGFVTKNYTFNGIVNWFNGTGAVAINEQSNYFFQSIAAVTGRLPGTISFNNFGGVGTLFSAISTFKISEQSLAGYTLEDYLPVLIGNKIVLAQLDDLNNFGIYQVVNIARDLIETTFFNVLVVYQNGHGALELDKFYGISLHGVSDTTVPDLNTVLSVGNTSLLDANIGQLGIYDTGNDAYAKIYSTDKNFQFKNANDNLIFSLEPSFFVTYKSADIAGSISVSNLTDTRIFELPDASGTVALTSDIPSPSTFVPYTGAISNVNLGNNDLYVNEIFLYDGPNDNYGSIHFTDSNFHIEDADGHPLFVVEDGYLQLHQSATIQSNLWLTDLTAIRDHYLPDESGTIALTSNIPLVDAAPTDGSNNAVSSNGVFDALATKENTIIPGTTSQYFRGDKTFQTLNKAAVGLGNVDNTSDADKPVSSAQLTAINAKVSNNIVDGVTTIAPSQNAVFDALALKQNTLAFTPEDIANKSTSTSLGTSNTLYPTQNAVKVYADTKQSALGFTPENVSNKSTTIDLASDIKYPTTKAVGDYALSKSFPQFSFKANNTSGNPAAAQDIYFQQTGKQTYTGTVTWSGTTAPSGTTNHTFNWIRIGNMVTLNITLHYSVAGTANTGAVVPLLSSMPTPVIPDGLGSTGEYIYPAYGKMSLADTSITTAASEVAMRNNLTSDGYDLVITQGSTGAKTLKITCQYFTA